MRDCTLKFGKMKTAVGMAYDDGTMELSSHFVEVGFDVWDTIIHEMAHIAVGIEHYHDKVWMGVYRELGGVGERLVDIPDEYLPRPSGRLSALSARGAYRDIGERIRTAIFATIVRRP